MSPITNKNALNDEIELLQSMYPEEISFNEKASQLGFKLVNGSLDIRIPNEYPSDSLPDLIAATGPSKRDIRVLVKTVLSSQTIGEPCLDAIITEFINIVESLAREDNDKEQSPVSQKLDNGDKTVIIWLHHLLATGKRKQALSPGGSQTSHVSGITKPGYPGVMIFSGPAWEVEEHVQALKHLRWQAFQIRGETAEAWSFAHGLGIIEVESMSEVVTELEGSSRQKELFMEAMKIK